MRFLYIFIDDQLYMVGSYDADGLFIPESSQPTRFKAAERVRELNGGAR